MILVTGGAGYIGCIAVRQLLDKGEAVRVYDKLYFGDEGLAEVRDKIELVQGDIRDLRPRRARRLRRRPAPRRPVQRSRPPSSTRRRTRRSTRTAPRWSPRRARRRGIKRFINRVDLLDLRPRLLRARLPARRGVRGAAARGVRRLELRGRADPARDGRRSLLSGDPAPGHGLRLEPAHALRPGGEHLRARRASPRASLTVHAGGEMWRPLVDVTDLCRVYIACVEAPDEQGARARSSTWSGRTTASSSWRTGCARRSSRVKKVEIEVDYTTYKTRSYRVSGERIQTVLGVKPLVGVKESVEHMLRQIERAQADGPLQPALLQHRVDDAAQRHGADAQAHRGRLLTRVVVVGSTGQLGSDLVEAFAARARCTGSAHEDMDIGDDAAVRARARRRSGPTSSSTRRRSTTCRVRDGGGAGLRAERRGAAAPGARRARSSARGWST